MSVPRTAAGLGPVRVCSAHRGSERAEQDGYRSPEFDLWIGDERRDIGNQPAGVGEMPAPL